LKNKIIGYKYGQLKPTGLINRVGGSINHDFSNKTVFRQSIIFCFLSDLSKKMYQKLLLFKSEALKNRGIFFHFKGDFKGAKPPAKLWVSKADRLNKRVGGLINYDFLDKSI